MKNKNSKRKIQEDTTGKLKSTPKKVIEENEADSDVQDDLLKTVEIDNEEDTTDDEGIENTYNSDNESDLSFESDEEGNYTAKLNGNSENVSDGESEDDDDDDDDSDDDDGDNDSEDDEDREVESEVEDEEDKKSDTESKESYEGENNNEKVNINNKDKNKTKIPEPTKKDIIEKKKSKFKEKGKNIKNLSNNINKNLEIKEEEGTYTSDEEDVRNTVGNIPMHWYDEYKHIGYDWDAKKIVKPAQGDQIDEFLKKIEDPNFWRTVKDPQTGQEVIITEEDIDLIKRVNIGKIPDKGYNQYEEWIEWFTSEVEEVPIKNVPDHKRSFLPSTSEKKKVSRMVHALKMGWMKTTEELEKEKKAKKGPKFYMLWETDTGREEMRRIHDHVTAPKRDLPGHAESYNPPPEYLFDEKEMKEWQRLETEPHKRKLHFLPQKYNTLREVPAYSRYIRERFLRCLDLYLCPRAKRTKLNIDAEYLIPKLPSPRDLQPFPTVESMVYRGHSDFVRTISIEPKGEYLISGSDDMTVKIWEISTGRCIRTIETDDVVRCVAWSPNPKLSLVAVASGQRLLLLNPKVGDKILISKTDKLLSEAPQIDAVENERISAAVQWEPCTDKTEMEKGVRIIIKHFKPITQVTWHGKGDYFATVMPEGANRSALIHQLSKRSTQIPFSKSKGLIQYVLFHPIKPCLFVATQHNIRIYDLVKQELVKKLLSNSKWISGMAIHPKGDNLLVSTYDKKMLWFDLDLSTKPYQTIRLHKNAVRSVSFHLRYPLFASASDDLSVIVSHGMVYNDLLQNPLIVPLKKLLGHEAREELGVLGVIWHPTQPWVFTSGADTTIRLFT